MQFFDEWEPTESTLALIKAEGVTMMKKPNPVHMLKVDNNFTVQTNEGVMSGSAGDFVAYDPMSGHIWPVSAAYVAMHYDLVPEPGANA